MKSISKLSAMPTLRKTALLLALLLLSGLAPASPDEEYGEVYVPVVPGVRQLYEKVTLNLVKPHLDEAGGDWLFAADLASESMSGASNYATALGNGRLFVEISPWAELAVFRWPNPTYADHLRYFTFENGITLAEGKPVRLGDDAPSKDWARYGRPVEPCHGLGSSAGAVLPGGEVAWSHDPAWKSSRSFEPEDSTILRTTLQGDNVEITVEDFLHPELDLMVRDYTVKGARKFLYHGSFAPLLISSAHAVESDPKEAGYATAYLADSDAVVHFKPRRKGLSMPELTEDNLSADSIDRAFPEGGVFVAWKILQGSQGHQAGPDACEDEKGVSGPLRDSRDGQLSGNDLYIGKGDAALSRTIDPIAGRVSVAVSVSRTAKGAVALLQKAKSQGPDSLHEQSRQHWQETSASIYLPQGPGEVTEQVCRRSVLNLIQGQGDEHGSVVASVSRQPHYHFDWPRDGAFFDLTLDMAGFPGRVDRHHEYYRKTQYRDKLDFAFIKTFNFELPFYRPRGHWPPNMAADGTAGSIPKVLQFEIDETALMVWDFWRHERVLAGTKADEYRRRMKKTMGLAADATFDYVDFKQAWTKPAVEDDNFPPDATLHGVAAVLTGMAAACDAGPRWGFSEERTEKWCRAARVLKKGVRERIGKDSIRERTGWRGLSWSLWPAPVFDDFNAPAARSIKAELARRIREKVDKQTPGFAYLGEEIFSLALADREQGEYTGLLKEALKFLTSEVPFPGTNCYGEVTLWIEMDGEKLSQQRTSIPHIWNGVTVYLAAMAVYEPEAFDIMKPPAP